MTVHLIFQFLSFYALPNSLQRQQLARINSQFAILLPNLFPNDWKVRLEEFVIILSPNNLPATGQMSLQILCDFLQRPIPLVQFIIIKKNETLFMLKGLPKKP